MELNESIFGMFFSRKPLSPLKYRLKNGYIITSFQYAGAVSIILYDDAVTSSVTQVQIDFLLESLKGQLL